MVKYNGFTECTYRLDFPRFNEDEDKFSWIKLDLVQFMFSWILKDLTGAEGGGVAKS